VLPAGYLADRYRRTRIIAIVMASWGAISALNAAVVGYVQFLAVRTVLGVGETDDNPSSSSLIADYYRPDIRGRAYAFQGVAPIVGGALGIALGGGVGEVLGWRWAFLLVGAPGSLLALAVWRLPEPKRGEHDLANADADEAPSVVVKRHGVRGLLHDVRLTVRIRTLRSLMIGNAIATGALAGINFWAPSFLKRHADLSGGAAAGIVGALIFGGAIAGTMVGGRLSDRLRGRAAGAPMVAAATTQAIGAIVLMPVFADVPLAVRIALAGVGVVFLVAGFPALRAMVAEVAPPSIRGLAFSVTGFLSALAAALSPLLIGGISDRFDYEFEGRTVGNLAYAFAIVMPLVLVGSFVVWHGRRHVEGDKARAVAAT
jgi:MFS family permease